MKISSETIKQVTGLESKADFDCEIMGMSFSKIPGTLTFFDNKKFLSEIRNNPNISAVFTTEVLSGLLDSKLHKIICEDPRYYFYSFYNYFAVAAYSVVESKIDMTAQIHPTAFVSDNNVTIGRDVILEPMVVILPDVEIGDGTIIRSGTVVGSEGFEHKKTSRGILSVKHDGKVLIGCNVEIGAGSTVAKGFSFRNTLIGDCTKIDNLVHIAHAAQIGRNCLIAAGTITSGSISVGENVWIGPNATISNRIEVGESAFISLGAVVVNDLKPADHVSGNFAVPHKNFLRFFTKLLRGKL